MSKAIKQMQMDSLKQTFGEVRDLVLLSMSGVPAMTENQMRLALRKKKVRLHQVKNSLANRVFVDLGISGLDPHLQGPTTIAWGPESVADLTKALEEFLKKNEKTIKPKVAVADGVIVSFEAARKFPTRLEAIGRVVSLVLSPAARLAGMLKGPGSTLAGQIKAISEKTEAAPEAAPAA